MDEFEKRVIGKTTIKRKYWYRIFIGECPVCGKDKSYKERVYGPKPKSIKKRYVRIPDNETYDYCDI